VNGPLAKLADVNGVLLAMLQDAVRLHRGEFGVVDMRESFEGTPHGDTETIYLRAPPWPFGNVAQLQDEVRVVNWPVLQLEQRFGDGLQALQHISGLAMARAMLVKLKPGGQVKPHVDEGLYASCTERFHYVVETNTGAVYSVDGVDEHLPVGTLWWFDKTKEHWAFNNGQTDRIHLIFDGWKVP